MRGRLAQSRLSLVLLVSVGGLFFFGNLWSFIALTNQQDSGNFASLAHSESKPITNHYLSAKEKLLQDALKEKQDRKASGAAHVLVMSPLGNSSATQRTGGKSILKDRLDYKHGSDSSFLLECSLQKHGHHSLIHAVFDDSAGYDSLDIRKVTVVYETALDLLQSKQATSTTLVLVVDAFDVIVQTTPLELVQEYDAQPFPIVVGGEPTCWNPTTGDVESNTSTPFCTLPQAQRSLRPHYYLNSGVYVATLGTLIRFLRHVLQHLPTAADGLAPWPGTTDKFNDQAYWSYWYIQYHPLIGLDDDEKLSFIANIGKARRPRTRLKEGTLIVKRKYPGIVHFPGQGGKTFQIYKDIKDYYFQQCASNEHDGT